MESWHTRSKEIQQFYILDDEGLKKCKKLTKSSIANNSLTNLNLFRRFSHAKTAVPLDNNNAVFTAEDLPILKKSILKNSNLLDSMEGNNYS